MKKKLLVAVLCSFTMSILHAQSLQAATAKEIRFAGHTIRSFKTGTASYGYDILFQGRLFIHQSDNPFTGLPGGLTSVEDAFKVARWQVIQLNLSHHQNLPGILTVPLEVARQLKITITNQSSSTK